MSRRKIILTACGVGCLGFGASCAYLVNHKDTLYPLEVTPALCLALAVIYVIVGFVITWPFIRRRL